MMQYGDLRSSFSPQGREYVTRWNPQTVPVVSSGSPISGLGGSSSPLASALMGYQPTQGEGRDGASSEPSKGETGASAGSPTAAIGGSFPGVGYGNGGKFGAIGAGLGLAAGVPGAGLVGNMVGTGFDVATANKGLESAGLPGIGLGGYASGVLNNATFGMLGTNIGRQWGDTHNRHSPYGMFDPQDGYSAPAADPFSNPMADPYGGVDPNNSGPASDPFAGGDPYGGVDPNGGGGGYDGGGYGAGMNDGSGSDAPGGFAKGGHVTRDRLIGPDPHGPDDGYAALDHGEYVIKASDVKKLGGPDKTRKRLAELLASK